MGTDFGADLPQIRFLYALISFGGSFGGTGSRKPNQHFLQCKDKILATFWGDCLFCQISTKVNKIQLSRFHRRKIHRKDVDSRSVGL